MAAGRAPHRPWARSARFNHAEAVGHAAHAIRLCSAFGAIGSAEVTEGRAVVEEHAPRRGEPVRIGIEAEELHGWRLLPLQERHDQRGIARAGEQIPGLRAGPAKPLAVGEPGFDLQRHRVLQRIPGRQVIVT